MHNNSYINRTYRNWSDSEDLLSFQVTEFETDLFISAEKDLYKEALKSVILYRNQIKNYIKTHSEFETSFKPVKVIQSAPEIIKDMSEAALKADVGPFAAVAGAMAEYVGKDLLNFSSQVIVENGGDIFISSKKDRVLGIYAGKSPLTGKIGLLIKTELMPVGVCTSSGTVGHSTSFGKADAVVIMSKNTSLSDSVATATANIIQKPEDIEEAINFALSIDGILGIVAIINSHIGAAGKLEIVRTINNQY